MSCHVVGAWCPNFSTPFDKEDGMKERASFCSVGGFDKADKLGYGGNIMNRIRYILIILIGAVLFGTGLVWYAQTRPKPITEYVPPAGNEPFPSGLPTTTPQQVSPTPPSGTIDTRSWGERFRDPTIPEIPGVAWQTYTNKEYGFEMEYPQGFWIETKEDNTKDMRSHIYVHPPGSRIHMYGEDLPYRTLVSITVSPKSLKEFVGEGSYLDQRFKKQGMTPDATLHSIDLFIENPDGQSNQNFLFLYFEKYGHSYGISETYPGDNEKEKKLTEHIIKTFRFLKE